MLTLVFLDFKVRIPQNARIIAAALSLPAACHRQSADLSRVSDRSRAPRDRQAQDNKYQELASWSLPVFGVDRNCSSRRVYQSPYRELYLRHDDRLTTNSRGAASPRPLQAIVSCHFCLIPNCHRFFLQFTRPGHRDHD